MSDHWNAQFKPIALYTNGDMNAFNIYIVPQFQLKRGNDLSESECSNKTIDGAFSRSYQVSFFHFLPWRFALHQIAEKY